jgi:hypothetical protein
MLPSVRALLTGIIDYAGLFPPARLPMSDAVDRFAGTRRPPRLVAGALRGPCARLEERRR